MGVIKNKFLDCYTPICDDCGIALCWDIDETIYKQNIKYWDNWKCDACKKLEPRYQTQVKIGFKNLSGHIKRTR
jgi:hypothetical protein